MCGIIAAISQKAVTDIILAGLKRLEYRGYDSAGITVLDPNSKKLSRVRVEGKVDELIAAIKRHPLEGMRGIGHTRWATHGIPSERNAHPLISQQKVAVVHNGIIENHDAVRVKLLNQGYHFESETDTEVAAHFFHQQYEATHDLLTAAMHTARALSGAFALAILHADEPDVILGIRSGSPLVVGLGENENFLASDKLALLPVTSRFITLHDGDIVLLVQGEVSIFNNEGESVEREIIEVNTKLDVTDKGGFRHYMLKEIMEQPLAVRNTLESRIKDHKIDLSCFGQDTQALFSKVRRVHFVACGTSYHASLMASYWLESLANIPSNAYIASEYRYRQVVVEEETLLVSVSQSGETADTLAALKLAKSKNYLAHLAICNVAESALSRESDHTILTHAGPEIGVASTKAFTTQLAVMLLMVGAFIQSKNSSSEKLTKLISQLQALPNAMEQLLELDSAIQDIARLFVEKDHALFIGRGIYYPLMMEAALKLKEISYIHAEAYPAGELKHGPLALVDANMPVIAVCPYDELIEKNKSNMQEIRARNGQLVVLADHRVSLAQDGHTTVIAIPPIPDIIAPLAYVIPLQMLAYYEAVLRGTDVDQPRNLAKSVTVE